MTQTFTQGSWINYQYIKLQPTLHIIRAMKSNQFQIILTRMLSYPTIKLTLLYTKGIPFCEAGLLFITVLSGKNLTLDFKIVKFDSHGNQMTTFEGLSKEPQFGEW